MRAKLRCGQFAVALDMVRAHNRPMSPISTWALGTLGTEIHAKHWSSRLRDLSPWGNDVRRIASRRESLGSWHATQHGFRGGFRVRTRTGGGASAEALGSAAGVGYGVGCSAQRLFLRYTAV